MIAHVVASGLGGKKAARKGMERFLPKNFLKFRRDDEGEREETSIADLFGEGESDDYGDEPEIDSDDVMGGE